MKKILGINYDIKEIEQNAVDDIFMGRCDNKNCIITINKTLSKQQKDLTILHETLHAVSHLLNLDLTETQVCGVSTALINMGIKLGR